MCIPFKNWLNIYLNYNFYDNPPISNSYIKISNSYIKISIENEIWWKNSLKHYPANYNLYVAKLKLLLSFVIISSDECILSNLSLDLIEKISKNIKESYQNIIIRKRKLRNYYTYSKPTEYTLMEYRHRQDSLLKSMLCKFNNIQKSIIVKALILFKHINNINYAHGDNKRKYIINMRGPNRIELIAACIYYGAKMANDPRTQKEIATAFNIDVTNLTRGCGKLKEILDENAKCKFFIPINLS